MGNASSAEVDPWTLLENWRDGKPCDVLPAPKTNYGQPQAVAPGKTRGEEMITISAVRLRLRTMLRDASQDNNDAKLYDLKQAASFMKADYGEFGYALGNRLLALADELRKLRSALGDDPSEPKVVACRSCNSKKKDKIVTLL